MVKDKKSLFEMRRDRLEHIVSIDYVGEDEEYKSLLQKDFAIEMNSYKNDIAWMVRAGNKVDTLAEHKWEDDILSKAIRSGLFDDSEEMVRMLTNIEEEIMAKPPKPRERRKKIKEIDAEVAMKKYIDMGKTIKEAEQLVKDDIMRTDGYEVCSVCGKYLDRTKGDVLIKQGRCYCIGCWDKTKDRGKPFMVMEHKIKCEKCGTRILIGDLVGFICPPGENERTSLKCKWYCGKCWDGASKEEKAEWRRRTESFK